MNILIVSPEDLTELTGGASNRAYHLAKALKKAGNTVIILQPEKKGKQSTYCDEFEIYTYPERIGKRQLYFFNDVNPLFLRAVVNLMKQRSIDVVQVELPWGVVAVCAIRKLIGKGQKVVYNSHNVQTAVQNELARHVRTEKGSSFLEIVIAYVLAINTHVVEKLAARLSDTILCVSSIDKLAFISTYGTSAKKIALIPNGASLQKAQSALRSKDLPGLNQSRLTIVFHGMYAYAPNKEAVRCIIDEIAPYFERYGAEVQFVIAGSGVPQCELGNVRCLGFVDDIYSMLKSADIAIVPLASGSGTRLKILEYFAAGLPVVTTRKGIEGIDAMNQEHALIVDTTEEFIQALTFLIDHKQERERISANALELIKRLYDWDIVGKRLNQLYAGLTKQTVRR